MPQLKLTKGSIETVAKPGGRADVLYWDSNPKGFGLRVTPTGKSTFIVQGRVEGSAKEARITIGPFGVFTVDQARDIAREHLRTMKMGTDLREVKKAAKAVQVDDAVKLTTLQSVFDAYVERPGMLKDSTIAEMRRHIDKVFVAWKDMPILSITRDMVRDRHRELVVGGLNGKKAAPASANAAMVTLRVLFNFAMDEYRLADGKTPLVEHNPVAALKNHWAQLGDREDRYIELQDIGKVWNALQQARVDPKNRDALAGIDLTIFALLTGCRRMEAAALSWNRVSIDGENPANWWWHLPNPKNGKAVWLPLPSQAVALLRERRQGTNSTFVFPSWSKAGHIMDARATMEMVSTIVGKHLSLHDMRRTFTNLAIQNCLIEKFRTDLLTNHKPAQDDVTARNYLNLSRLSWLQPDVQKIGDLLDEQGREATKSELVEGLAAEIAKIDALEAEFGELAID